MFSQVLIICRMLPLCNRVLMKAGRSGTGQLEIAGFFSRRCRLGGIVLWLRSIYCLFGDGMNLKPPVDDLLEELWVNISR
jgi:hypothetical protein